VTTLAGSCVRPTTLFSTEIVTKRVGKFVVPTAKSAGCLRLDGGVQSDSELSMGWVDPWVGLGCIGLGRVGSRFFSFWWVGLGWVGSTVAKVLKI